ncbi:MAG: hydroxymethylglutaryl-CoA reductase, degradative [Myxococcota bacterium]
MSERSSRIPGLYKLSTEERLAHIAAFAELSEEEVSALRGSDPQRLAAADKMIENVVGLFHLPVGFAANFRLDGADRLMPMVIEEPSVVAAASNAAKLLRSDVGIATRATAPVMIGQIQLCDVPDVDEACRALKSMAAELVETANESAPRLVARGGGARGFEVRRFDDTPIGPMIVCHVLVDVCDAMGANLVNAMCERLAPRCETASGGRAFLKILSNLADRRLVYATGRVPLERLARPDLDMDGATVAERIVRASVFAEVDPYRAATHNKGIMNGVDAFLLATGQDWRAVEAGAHAHAASSGRYTAMATWRLEDDALVGRITLPMQVGVVGGIVKVHPVVKVNLKVLGAETASEVGRAAAAVGLAQNLAAIMALATEGIQRGHMSLHARNIAAAAGAREDQIDKVVAEMIRRRTISHDAASSILDESRPSSSTPLSLGDVIEARDQWWPVMEDVIASVVPKGEARGTLGDMVWYQLETGGKRLRAALVPIVCDAMGGEPGQVAAFGAAVELLHNATLLHDDTEERLRTRRGKDTLWVRYGSNHAVLAGDGLMSVARRCLNELPHSPETVQRLSTMVTEHMLRVISAQIQASGGTRDLKRWQGLVRDRTGGLIALALSGSALLAGAPRSLVELLDAIGGHLGVIFQVQDELLDLLGAKPQAPNSHALVDGKPGLLVAHAYSHASESDAAQLRDILDRPPSLTTDDDVTTARELLQRYGSLVYGADLLQAEQAEVDRLARNLDHPPLQRLLSGVTDVFLTPLLTRLGRS